MKLLIENWRSYLKEIGEASLEPYDFKSGFSDEDQVWYDFVSSDNPMDEGSDYLVKFTTGGPGSGDDAWDISFEANETVQTTNEGQPLKIMATVVAIVKDFIDRPELNRGMRKFVFMGVGKVGEEGPERTSRTKMYLRFLKKNMPAGTKIREAGENVIFFEVPGGDQEELDENDYPITAKRANKEINQVITPTKKKNARTKLPGWKQAKADYLGSAPPGAGGS